jgi:hypothetical protein
MRVPVDGPLSHIIVGPRYPNDHNSDETNNNATLARARKRDDDEFASSLSSSTAHGWSYRSAGLLGMRSQLLPTTS